MSMKKVLVYDGQRYFSRYLRYEYGDEFDFNVFINFKEFDGIVSGYSFMVFVIYSERELLDLMRIYKQDVKLIICTLNKDILQKLKKIEDILIFDMSEVKSEMVKNFDFYLELIR
jgi:hypothetical protein